MATAAATMKLKAANSNGPTRLSNPRRSAAAATGSSSSGPRTEPIVPAHTMRLIENERRSGVEMSDAPYRARRSPAEPKPMANKPATKTTNEPMLIAAAATRAPRVAAPNPNEMPGRRPRRDMRAAMGAVPAATPIVAAAAGRPARLAESSRSSATSADTETAAMKPVLARPLPAKSTPSRRRRVDSGMCRTVI